MSKSKKTSNTPNETINVTALPESKASVLDRMREQQPTSASGIPKDVSLIDFARYWLVHMKTDIKESTACSYESNIENHIYRVFEDKKLSEITSEDVQLFIMSLTQGMDLDDPLSPKTIRNIHGVLHRILQDAYDMKVIDENPAKHTKLPKVKKPEIIPMNNNQVHAFLRAIIGHPLEDFFKLALFTGIRKAELIGLTWDCFYFDEGSIRVYRQRSYDRRKGGYFFDSVKNGKPRMIYPAPDVMDMMKRLYNSRPKGEYVFRNLFPENDSGCPHLTLRQIRTAFEKILSDLGWEKFRFHDLRHTYAVLSIKAGVDLKTLSETMGHYSVAFTLDTYAFALTDMKEECAKRMQSFLDEQNFRI